MEKENIYAVVIWMMINFLDSNKKESSLKYKDVLRKVAFTQYFIYIHTR